MRGARGRGGFETIGPNLSQFPCPCGPEVFVECASDDGAFSRGVTCRAPHSGDTSPHSIQPFIPRIERLIITTSWRQNGMSRLHNVLLGDCRRREGQVANCASPPDAVQPYFRSSARYWIASARCAAPTCSAPATSAMVRTTLRIRVYARALSPNRAIAVSISFSLAASS
jgi:hypothetical protein